MDDRLIEVRVKLHPRDVWEIQEKAEKKGVTPGQVVRAALYKSRSRLERETRVRSRVLAGLCDADIGLELGMTVGQVASMRRGMGLPANRRFPKRERKSA